MQVITVELVDLHIRFITHINWKKNEVMQLHCDSTFNYAIFSVRKLLKSQMAGKCEKSAQQHNKRCWPSINGYVRRSACMMMMMRSRSKKKHRHTWLTSLANHAALQQLNTSKVVRNSVGKSEILNVDFSSF